MNTLLFAEKCPHLPKCMQKVATFPLKIRIFDDYLELPMTSYYSIYFSTLNIELPRWLSSKESACNAGNAGDTGSIPGSRRWPGGVHGNSLLYSCLKNLMDRRAWWATVYRVSKSQTWLKQLSKQAHWTCHSMEKAMAPHSSTLAWKIPWTEQPSRLQSMGSQRVRHDWVTSLSLFTFMHWRRKWQPTLVFLPGESRGQRSLVGCHLWGRTESDTTEAT